MSKQIEFGKFYKILDAVKSGDKEKKEELDWLLAEYEHAKESAGPYDELGQIFCHIGVMELYEYAGIDQINYISSFKENIWDYLKQRTGEELTEYLIRKMQSHSNEHGLTSKISKNWKFPEEELSMNVEGLARYVAEGIVDTVRKTS